MYTLMDSVWTPYDDEDFLRFTVWLKRGLEGLRATGSVTGLRVPEWGNYSLDVWRLLTPAIPYYSASTLGATGTTGTATGTTGTTGTTGKATGTTATTTSTTGTTGTTDTATGTTGTATGTATGTTGTPGTTFWSSSMYTPMDISDDEDFAVNCEW